MNGDDEANEAEREALEIQAMKARVAEMEQEAAKLREMTAANEVEAEQNGATGMTDDEKEAVDSRSIYVGNVSLRLLCHSACEEARGAGADVFVLAPSGRLRLNARGDSGSLCFVRYYQPSDDPL